MPNTRKAGTLGLDIGPLIKNYVYQLTSHKTYQILGEKKKQTIFYRFVYQNNLEAGETGLNMGMAGKKKRKYLQNYCEKKSRTFSVKTLRYYIEFLTKV